MLHENSGANVWPGACGHIMCICTWRKKEHKREHTGKKNKTRKTSKDVKHLTCLLFRCIRGGSGVEETTVSSQFSVYINAVSAHAANTMLFLG